MNERIKELAFLAAQEPNSNFDCDVVWLEKFSELLIKECAIIVNSLEEYESKGDCSKAEYIKEYFGVK